MSKFCKWINIIYSETKPDEEPSEQTQDEPTKNICEGKTQEQLKEEVSSLEKEIEQLETEIEEAAANDDFDEADRLTAIQDQKSADVKIITKYLSDNFASDPDSKVEDNQEPENNSGNDDNVENKIIKNISEAEESADQSKRENELPEDEAKDLEFEEEKQDEKIDQDIESSSQPTDTPSQPTEAAADTNPTPTPVQPMMSLDMFEKGLNQISDQSVQNNDTKNEEDN